MGSKGIIFFCISLAVIVMTASEVGARDLAATKKSTPLETTNEVKNTGVETTMHEQDGDRGYPGGSHGGYPGGGHGGYPGGHHGGHGGHGGYPGGHHGGHGGHGGHCRRCCHYGRCHCCSYSGEAVEAEP